jgi:hypothetical protein
VSISNFDEVKYSRSIDVYALGSVYRCVKSYKPEVSAVTTIIVNAM